MNKEKIKQLIMLEASKKTVEKALNDVEEKYTNLTLDKIVEYADYKDKNLEKVFDSIYEIQLKVDNFEFEDNLQTNIDGIAKLQNEYLIISTDYKKQLDKISDKLVETTETLKSYNNMILNELQPWADEFTVMTIYRRFNIIQRKIRNIIISFNTINIEDFDLLGDDLLTLARIADRKIKRHNKQAKETIEKYSKEIKRLKNDKYKKIFDYKEMCKYAIEQGYIKCRQCATSHIIFEHPSTGKIIPIPAHNLGYGLMRTIKQQIHANKVA